MHAGIFDGDSASEARLQRPYYSTPTKPLTMALIPTQRSTLWIQHEAYTHKRADDSQEPVPHATLPTHTPYFPGEYVCVCVCIRTFIRFPGTSSRVGDDVACSTYVNTKVARARVCACVGRERERERNGHETRCAATVSHLSGCSIMWNHSATLIPLLTPH